MEQGKTLDVNRNDLLAYTEALDAVLLSRCEALVSDAVWESIMHLRERLAGAPFNYPVLESPRKDSEERC